ncbi:MAG TPA: helix-turn-helix domain-containing protein, partial [Desulfuromonadales bacterium]|nr:helix-turn-helix domain-containing protein [Desulfuromonadales bacterium]
MTESEPLNIGNKLRHRRQELNLSLDEVARQTKIRKTYILAIEEERFEELPGKVYIVGFLQN